MKSTLLNACCQKCGKQTSHLRKELLGYFLLLVTAPYLWIFGVNAGSIIYSSVFVTLGIRWVITKPSLRVYCEECR